MDTENQEKILHKASKLSRFSEYIAYCLGCRLVCKDREMRSFCLWDSIFRNKCYWRLARINSENISEGSPVERFYVTSLSWDSEDQASLGTFSLYILDFERNRETQPSITVLPSGYYKALRFWDYCFLESAYETLYGLINREGNWFCLWQNHHFSLLQEFETSDDTLYCDLVP